MGLLFFLRFFFQLAGQEQALTKPPAHDGLGPNLVNLLIERVPHELLARLDAHVHRPEPAVARAISQEHGGVGGAEEHAAARQLLDVTPVGRPEPVCPQRQELLDASHI